MRSGKYFPQNTRALRIYVEGIYGQSCRMNQFPMVLLNLLAKKKQDCAFVKKSTRT